MGIFDAFKKEKPKVVTQTVKFSLTPGQVREVDDAGVEALDKALKAVGTGELLHAFDPQRLVTFDGGGPPTWSVAFVPVGDDNYFVTYGNSDRIDFSRAGRNFELAIRVPTAAGVTWPVVLLRALSRYILTSGRELRVGDFLPLPTPITRIAANPEGERLPDTPINTVVVVQDVLLPTVSTPRGPIEIRRVVGIFPDELELLSLWSAKGLVGEFQKRTPNLETNISRQSMTADATFVAAMRQGSRKEGSQYDFVAVSGVTWEMKDGICCVTLPGGADAVRIKKMLDARLPFGKPVMVHEVDSSKRLAVVFEPAQQFALRVDGELAVLQVPPRAPLIDLVAPPTGAPFKFKAKPHSGVTPAVAPQTATPTKRRLSFDELMAVCSGLARFISGEGARKNERYAFIAAFQGRGGIFAAYNYTNDLSPYPTTFLYTYNGRPIPVEVDPYLGWGEELASKAAEALAEGRLVAKGTGQATRLVSEKDVDALL